VPAIALAFAALLFFISWGSLKRNIAAWWAGLALAAFGLVYTTVFLRNIDFEAWYEAMGMPVDQQQLDLMQSMYSGPFYFLWIGAVMVGYFVFLFYIRRYFQNVERMMPPST
jgi:hypothetical protein